MSGYPTGEEIGDRYMNHAGPLPGQSNVHRTQKTIPEPPKPKHYVCATDVEHRSPKWKYHTNMGHAKNAANLHSNWNDVYIYNLVNEELELLWFIKRGTKEENMHWQKTEEALAKKKAEQTANVKRMIANHKARIVALEAELEQLDAN